MQNTKLLKVVSVTLSIAMTMQCAGMGFVSAAKGIWTLVAQQGIPMYTQQPGPIWRGESPGREPETRGGFYSPRTNDAIDEAARRWQRLPGGLAAGNSPVLVPGGLANGGGAGIPGEGTFYGAATSGGVVNTWNGNFMKAYGLAGWPTRGSLDFDFTLFHNSISDYDMEFGYGWSFNFGAKLHVEPNGTVIIRWGDGTVVGYTPNGSGGYTRPPGIFDELTSLPNGNFKITGHNQVVYEFTPPNGSLSNDLGDLIAIRDRNSNQITITISTSQTPGKERAIRVEDCVSSRYIDLTYNSTSARVEEIEDHTGRVWSFTYLNSDLDEIEYPILDGNYYSRYFDYDNHRISTETDLRGYDWTYGYQTYPGTKITSATNPLSKTWSFGYTATATTVTHPDTKTLIHYYSGGRLSSEVDEAGYSTNYKSYNADRLPTLVQDARSKYWSYTYDTRGNMLTATDPLSHVTTYTYQATNELLTAKNHLNEEWEYTYYPDGNLKETWDPENRRLAYFHYDTAGQLDWVQDANNEQTSVGYGSDGYPDTVTDPLSNTSVIELDALGRVAWVEDPIQAGTIGSDDRTDISYDTWDRQRVITHPKANPFEPRYTTQFAYDAEDNLTVMTDERGKTVSNIYDAAGQLTDTYNQKNEHEQYVYNDRGWVSQVINGRGNSRYNIYTPRGEVYEYNLSFGGITGEGETWSRDGNGNVTAHAYRTFGLAPQYETKQYVYDNANRLTLIDYLGAMTNVSFGYDNADRQTSMVDATGTTNWEYFLDGQTKKFISPQGTMRYDYNANAQLHHIYEEISGQPDLVTTYAYDEASRVATVNKFGETTTFQYDAGSRPERMTYGNGTYAKYLYDGRSRITAVEHYTSANALLRKETNVFDPASRITSRYTGPASGGVTTTFGYDDVGQLTGESDTTGYSAAYTYDANGNRLTRTLNGVVETYVCDAADKLTSVSWSSGGNNYSKTYAYHFSGRPTAITYKTNGITTATESLTWDKESRMLTNSLANSSYLYNAIGARVTKTVGSVSTTFKRGSAGPVSPVLSDTSSGTLTSYLPGLSSRVGTQSTFSHSGVKNGVLQTGPSQSTTATKRYDAFGNELSSTGTWQTRFDYGGEYGYQRDDESGYRLLGHRYYDRSTGRFLSRDLVNDGRNWYLYVGNNPIAAADPSGLTEVWVYWYEVIGGGYHTGIALVNNLIPGKPIMYSFAGGPEVQSLNPLVWGNLVPQSGAWAEGNQDWDKTKGKISNAVVVVNDDSDWRTWRTKLSKLEVEMVREEPGVPYDALPLPFQLWGQPEVANSNSWARELLYRAGLMAAYDKARRKRGGSPWAPGWARDVWQND